MIMPVMDENHKYWIGDRHVMSVTQILREAGFVDTTGYNDFSRDRGITVHQAIHFHTQEDLNEQALDPLIIPYIDQWKKFLKISGFKIIKTEQIVYSAKYNYCGTLDQYGEMHGKPIICDVKTGHIPAWAGLQTWAYAQAARECGAPKCQRFALELGPEKFKLKKFADPSDGTKFIAALKKIGVYNGN